MCMNVLTTKTVIMQWVNKWYNCRQSVEMFSTHFLSKLLLRSGAVIAFFIIIFSEFVKNICFLSARQWETVMISASSLYRCNIREIKLNLFQHLPSVFFFFTSHICSFVCFFFLLTSSSSVDRFPGHMKMTNSKFSFLMHFCDLLNFSNSHH